MAIITAHGVEKTFTSGTLVTHVLRGITLSVEQGEFVAIMGKSGAGKSTLMYQLSAIDQPTAGEIFIDGVKTTEFTDDDLAEFRLYTLGYIFQDYALIPDLDALENVMLPLIMRNIAWSEAKAMALAALESVELTNRQSNLPSQLSGGEQQRVAIARAIAGKPKILFADEPTANLDSTSGKAVIKLLSNLHKEGQTVIMVTHEEEYTLYCDHIIRVEDGLVTKEERPTPSV